MGFFASLNKPEAPKPLVVVRLEKPEGTVYRPNDTISGHVEISTEAMPFTGREAVVSFWGESRVWIRTSSSSKHSDGSKSTDYYHYRDNVQLFKLAISLLPEFVSLQPGRVQRYPFRFKMPQGTNLDRAGCYKDPKDKPLSRRSIPPSIWTTLPHSLPPSFSHGRNGSFDTCSIQYGVTVELKFDEEGGFSSALVDSGDSHLSTSAIALIPFAPLSSSPDGDSSLSRTRKQFTLASSSLLGQDPQTIGFRQRIKDRLSSATPQLRFELGIEFPTALKAGHEFQFRCTYDVLDADRVVAIPPVTFKILKLALVQFTFFRAPWDWSAVNTMMGPPSKYARTGAGYRADDERISREDRQSLNAVPETQTVAMGEGGMSESDKGQKTGEQEQHCDAWFNGRVPGFTHPSFRSFAISVAYHLKAKIRVEVGGKEFDAEAASPAIFVGSG